MTGRVPAPMQNAICPANDLPGTDRRTWLISFCALISLVLYLILPGYVALLTSAEPSYAHEVFPWIKEITRQTLPALQHKSADVDGDVKFLALCAGLFAVYGFVLYTVRGRQPFLVQLVVFATGSAFILSQFFAPVMLSTDVFAYAVYGRILSIHGANAYAANVPMSSDPFLTLFGHEYFGSVYGPLWTLISAGLTRVGGDHIGLTVLLFRAFAGMGCMAAGVLIWRILQLTHPERTTQGLVMFLWNPLVIIEAGLSGHNDVVMIALALCGVWVHLKGFKSAAVVALTLSALVKFVTGMLVPLYILMVLRCAHGWRERSLFLGRSIVSTAVIITAISMLSRAKSDVPATSHATATDFYNNNFHELIFKGLRRLLGEDRESVQVPIYFGSWWISVEDKTELRAAPSDDSPQLVRIDKGRNVLVIAPHVYDWLRVYDPLTRKKGYISEEAFADVAPDPSGDTTDPELARLEDDPADWPTVIKANDWIRKVTWALFGLFGFLAAWKTVNFEQFLIWSTAALLASYFLIMTQMWPWYVVWALGFSALRPVRSPARLAIVLSISTLTLYVTIGYATGPEEWLYIYRSVPAMVLPLVLFLFSLVLQRLCGRAAKSGVSISANGVSTRAK